MYISHFMTMFIQIYLWYRCHQKSWVVAPNLFMAVNIQDHWPPLDLNCSRKQHYHGAISSSEARWSAAWTSRWWWATERILVIWHLTTGEVCRTVSVSHMSAQWVWCNRVWRRPCNYNTFCLHAGHVVLSWTWNTHMVKKWTCISSRVLPWK